MTRPTTKAKQVEDLNVMRIPHGMIEGEFKVKSPEDETERRHRLRKDFLSFLVKDLLAYLVAFLLVLACTIYSLGTLWHPGFPREDRQWAMSMLTSLGTAVVGFVFGKATK